MLVSFTCVVYVVFFSLHLSVALQCWQYCETLENQWEKTRTICEGDQYLHVSKFTGETAFRIRGVCTTEREFSGPLFGPDLVRGGREVSRGIETN